LLSGTQTSLASAVWRLLLAVAYTALMMLVVGTIGLFVSTLTEVPIAAMAGVLAVAIVSEVLAAIPQLHALAPWLFSHYWLSLGDFLRDPVRYDQVQKGALLALAYIVVFALAAWARFGDKDISS
jgi:ABC-2 type transport system permease protein